MELNKILYFFILQGMNNLVTFLKWLRILCGPLEMLCGPPVVHLYHIENHTIEHCYAELVGIELVGTQLVGIELVGIELVSAGLSLIWLFQCYCEKYALSRVVPG